MELGYQQWFESNIDISDVSDSVIDLDLDWVKNNVEFQNYRAKRSISNIINNTGPPDDGYDYTELHDSMSSDVGWKRDYPLILGVMISNSKLTSKYMRSKPNSKCSIKIHFLTFG